MIQRVALGLGPMLLLATLILPAPAGLEPAGWHVAGVAAWMAVWWLSAAIPLEATGLLPIALIPFLGIGSIGDATASYADPIIFLFLGGFLLGATLERWNLHKRFALATVDAAGTDGPKVVLAFMAASAALSMWISNTATAVMMLPIAGAVVAAPIKSADKDAARRFATALFLGVAYGCSIGGITTLIGTPPNVIFAAAARDLIDTEVGFGSWMVVGLGVAIPMFVVCWMLLIKLHKVEGRVPGLDEVVARERTALGRLEPAERFILAVFSLTALSWIFRAPKVIGGLTIPGLSSIVPGISDPGIAITAALVLFIVPLPRSRFPVALDWRSASKVPWGILLLFGGGLALARVFASSGLTQWVGARLQGLEGAPLWVIMLATVALFVFLTEMTSNAATTALGMPLVVGVAQGLGVAAFPLMVGATLAASMAFMLPVATPPNAIVFGSGKIRSQDMARTGLWLNGCAIAIITVAVLAWTGGG